MADITTIDHAILDFPPNIYPWNYAPYNTRITFIEFAVGVAYDVRAIISPFVIYYFDSTMFEHGVYASNGVVTSAVATQWRCGKCLWRRYAV